MVIRELLNISYIYNYIMCIYIYTHVYIDTYHRIIPGSSPPFSSAFSPCHGFTSCSVTASMILANSAAEPYLGWAGWYGVIILVNTVYQTIYIYLYIYVCAYYTVYIYIIYTYICLLYNKYICLLYNKYILYYIILYYTILDYTKLYYVI